MARQQLSNALNLPVTYKTVTALPFASGGDDTAAVQARLTAGAGGIVSGIPGQAYSINAPLIISSNTTLDMTGCTVTLAAASNCNLLRNTARTAARSVHDAAITASSATLTSATAAFTSGDTGKAVRVYGAGPAGAPLDTTMTYVNATTATLAATASTTVTAAAASVGPRDTNIEVIGGKWDRANNGWGGAVNSSVDLMTLAFTRVDGIKVRNVSLATTARGYQLHFGDVTNYEARSITLNAPNTVVNTDGVNVHGPALRGVIDTVIGMTGDDLVSIHSIDGDGNLQDTVGDVYDLVVRNLLPDQNGQAAFKVHAGAGTKCRSITASGIHGFSKAGAVHIQDYATPNSDSDCADIVVEDVDCQVDPSVGLVTVFVNAPTGTITLRDLVWRATGNSGVSVVYVPAGATLGKLVVDGMTLAAGTSEFGVQVIGTVDTVEVSRVQSMDTGVLFSSLLCVQTGGVVTTASLKRATVRMNGGSTNALVAHKGTLSRLIVDDVDLTNAGRVLFTNSSATALQALFSKITLSGANQLANVASTVDFTIDALNAQSITAGGLISLIGASAVVSVRGRGLINPNSYAAFTRDGTQTPRFNHPEMRVDIAQVDATHSGDVAFNTNTGQPFGAGPVICTGSSWRSLATKAVSPDDFTALGWTADPAHVGASSGPAGGKEIFVRFRAQVTGTVGHVDYYIATAGSGLTAGQCFVGIFDTGQATTGTATLLATSVDQAANGVGTATQTANFSSPPTVTAGQDYFIVFLWNGTTPPILAAATTRLINQGNLSGLSQRALITTAGGITALANQAAGNLTYYGNVFAAVARA